MAVVYLAIQEDLDRPVALKVLTDSLARDHEFVNRFLNEARAAAALTHPKIVQAYDAGFVEPDLYYFVMEFIRGETLHDRIRREHMLKLRPALGIAIDIAEALDYGWKRQMLVHGDIKPENIMVSASGDTKLADFGLAKVSGHDYSGRGIMLTPMYAAPEVIRGEKRQGDCRSDIYSFGATLFHTLSGQPPFPGTDPQAVLKRHLSEPPPLLQQINDKVPKEVSEFVGALLAKNPDARPQNWEQVLASLEWFHRRRLRTTAAPAAIPAERQVKGDAAPVTTATRPRSSAGWTLTLVLAVLGIAVLLAFGYWQRTGQNAARLTPLEESALEEWDLLKTELANETDVITTVERLEQYRRNHPGWAPPDFAKVQYDYYQQLMSRSAVRKTDPATVPGKAAPLPPAPVPPPPSAAVVTSPAVTARTPAPEAPEAELATQPVPAVVPPPTTPVLPQVRADAYTDLMVAILQNAAKLQANLEPMMQQGKQWLERFPGASDEKARVQFLLEDVLPAYDEFLPKLVVHKERVIGAVLPVKKYAGRPVKGVALTELTFTEKTDYGEVAVRVPWSDPDRVALLSALGKLAFEGRNLAPEERYPFMAFLLFNRQVKGLAEQISLLPESGEKRLWLLLQNDMTRAEVEGRALAVWRDAQQAAARGEFRRAYRALQELRATQSTVAFRYSQAVELLEKSCARRVPEAQLSLSLERAQQGMAAQPAESLALLTTVLNRYGRMPLPELLDLEKLRTKALTQLQERLPPPAGSPLVVFAPLLSFGLQVFPGQSALQYRQLQEMEGLPVAVKAYLPTLYGLCLLEMGDWAAGRKALAEHVETPATSLPGSLQMALCFGRALTAARYEDSGSSVTDAFARLKEIQSFTEANDPVAGVTLARINTELAVLARSWGCAQAPAPALEKLAGMARVPGSLPLTFMALTGALEAGRLDEVDAFLAALRTHAEPLSDQETLCLAIGDLLHRKTSRLPVTAAQSGHYQELYQRCLVSAVLRRPAGTIDAAESALWAELAARSRSDSPVGASAWFDVLLVQVGNHLRQGTAVQAARAVDEALTRTSAGAQPYYPRLRFLQAGLELLRGAPEMARETLAMVSLSTVASKAELEVVAALESPADAADPEKAEPTPGPKPVLFWSPWLNWAQATRDGKPAAARAALELMQQHAATAAQQRLAKLCMGVLVTAPATAVADP